MKPSALLLSLVLALSLVAGSVAAVEQSEASINRAVVDEATVGETVTVEVTVEGSAVVEEFDRELEPTIVDDDGATQSTDLSDRVGAVWNESGEHTLVYELEVPEAAGDVLELDGTASDGATIATSSSTIAIDGLGVDHYAEPGEVVESVVTVHKAYLDSLEERTEFQTVQRLWLSFINEEPLEADASQTSP